MTLDSAQAKVIAAQPRITPEERDQLISLLAEGKKPAELAVRFNKAPGTIANFQTRNKGEINEQRRKRTVQFEDLFIVRKQARLDDYQDLRNIAMAQIRSLLGSCFVIDGQTGQPEFAADLVDHRKLKVYSDMVFKADKLAAEETGQLPQRVDGLDSRYTAPVLGLGNGTIDYAKAAQRRRDWEAAAPEREAAARERDAVREAEMESLKQRMLVAAGVDKQGRDQRILENWLAREEQRLAQGLGLEEEWDVDDFAAVRADVERYFPGDEVMRDRVERFIATASRKPETNEGEGEVQELYRMGPSRPEPVEDAVEEPAPEPVEEPESEPEQPADYHAALALLISDGR